MGAAAQGDVAEAMFAADPGSLSADEVSDALGELTNMVAGNVKALLPESCAISLPTVALGTNYKINVVGTNGVLFFKVLFADWVDPQSASEYIAGMILLGVAPCTAMVVVWSQMTKGDPNYTLVYHFDGAAGAPSRDSTAYTNHAQTPPAGVIDGVVGRAAQFAGTAPMMLPASPSLAVPAAGAFTFSAWIRADQPAGQQLVYARRDGANSLLIGLDQGVPFVEVNGQRSPAGAPVSPGAWQHLAVTADGSQIVLYVQGRATASLAASLPPLNTVAALGGDVPGAAPAIQAPVEAEAVVAEGVETLEADAATVAAPSVTYAPFVGAIDELRLSKVARPAALIFADAAAQGAESRLTVYGVDEEQSGFGFGALGFLLGAVPFDAWIVLAVLAFMMVQSWIIMARKSRAVGRIQRANSEFRTVFAKVGQQLEMLADDTSLAGRLKDASLWRLYETAINEVRTRRAQGVHAMTPETIESIRASMDGVRTKENQQLGARMGILSNAIAGGPYIGLLGTVLGIMVVFLGTAMAGDVNINAIAPGLIKTEFARALWEEQCELAHRIADDLADVQVRLLERPGAASDTGRAPCRPPVVRGPAGMGCGDGVEGASFDQESLPAEDGSLHQFR